MITTASTILLNSGNAIPVIGNGSFAPATGNARVEAKEWILTALKNGYRHIDTAAMYGTEEAVGKAVKESGIKREDLFIVTKLPWTHHSRVSESLDESLKRLDMDYVDLYLMHWPICMKYDETDTTYTPMNPDGTFQIVDTPTFVDVWASMEEVYAQGKVKSIGVCNFSIKTLETLLKKAKVVPSLNQVEMHPYLTQNDLRRYCNEKGIVLAAFTPSGYNTVRSDPTILSIASKHSATPNQVILAWHLTRGTVLVPKSSNEERQRENLNPPTLDEEDIRLIDGLDRGQRILTAPDKNGKVLGWTLEQLGWQPKAAL